MAFQTNAFQNDGFQIASQSHSKIARYWLPKKPEIKKALKEYEKAIEVLESVETDIEEEKLVAVTNQFRTGDRLNTDEMEVLLKSAEAKKEFDEAIRLIKLLEAEVMELTAILLLASEA